MPDRGNQRHKTSKETPAASTVVAGKAQPMCGGGITYDAGFLISAPQKW